MGLHWLLQCWVGQAGLAAPTPHPPLADWVQWSGWWIFLAIAIRNGPH